MLAGFVFLETVTLFPDHRIWLDHAARSDSSLAGERDVGADDDVVANLDRFGQYSKWADGYSPSERDRLMNHCRRVDPGFDRFRVVAMKCTGEVQTGMGREDDGRFGRLW
jgi:hypothetical protein